MNNSYSACLRRMADESRLWVWPIWPSREELDVFAARSWPQGLTTDRGLYDTEDDDTSNGSWLNILVNFGTEYKYISLNALLLQLLCVRFDGELMNMFKCWISRHIGSNSLWCIVALRSRQNIKPERKQTSDITSIVNKTCLLWAVVDSPGGWGV